MKTEKLELKHLAPYLPYALKAEMLDYKIDYIGKQYDEIIGFHQWDKGGIYWSAFTIGGSKPSILNIKPILRPLSDLVKEIEYNGEKFIPLGKLHYKYCLTASGERTTKAIYDYHIDRNCYATYYGINGGSFGIYINTLEIDRTPYRILNWLFKWHFDVFRLIDKGLAIDINTLK